MSEVEAYARLAGVYDEIVVDPCFTRWAGFLHGLWSTDPPSVTSILDVCCGTGLMAAELRAYGYGVVGVDASGPMLERAGRLLGQDVVLLQQTLPDLDVDGPFDAAISTFDGLNYLTPPDFAATLQSVAAQLRPGGWFVFDLHTDAMLALAAEQRVISGEEQGTRFVITNDVDLAARTCDARIEVTGAGEAFSETHRQYFHSDQQVVADLTAAGFAVVTTKDEYSDASVGPSTLRATWIARRG